MEQAHYRPVRQVCSQKRISDRARQLSEPLSCSNSDALISRLREGTESSSRDKILAGQESDRGTRPRITLPGILQSNILGSQERRRLAAGVRLEVPQPICPQREIQDDYSQSGDQRVASRGLGGECRPQRRLLPHPHTQEVTTPTSVCCRNGRRAPGFPIQSPTVRIDFSAQGIHESNTTPWTPGAHARGLSSTVSRRLDTTKYRQVITGSANKLVAQCHAPSGSGTKRAQVTLGTHSATDTHRCRISSRRRTDVPTDGKSSKDRKQSISASIGSSSDSLFLALPAWTYELGNGCNPVRETAPQTSAVLPASPLGACIKESGSSYPSETHPARSSSSMVVGQEVHTGRDVVRHSRGSGAAIHRCVRVGLGSPYGNTSGKRSMVCEGGHVSHKPTGDDRSTECIVSLSDTVNRTSGSIDVRQCHRRFVSDETGRYSLTADVPTSEGSAAPSTRHAYYPSGQTHSGGEECTSRPSLPTRQGGSHGMDVSPDSSGFTVHHVGQAQCGPVCDSPQQQASGVCVTHGRPPSGRGRCHVDIMEGNVRLCIPPICDAGARAREDPRRSPLRVDPHCSQMAQSVLVRQTIGTAGRLSFGPAPQERSADPATQPSETSVTPSCAPTRLEAVQRSLEERGFSRAAAEQISRGRRQSSRAVYDSKWRIFSRWCSEQSVDPFQISIQKLADFFVFLFHEKGLNPRTIKGYRSAISSTISSCGSRTEFTNSPELASLIRSFQLERPPQRKIAPQWNLSLVLQALLKPPFEPIHACDLKSLTLKTVFLVALASGRRRSEIHALCFDSHHFRQNQDQSLLTLYPDLEFVAKNQVLDSVAEPIKLKAFTAVGSEDFDRKLCPVRALLQYRKVTSSPGCRKGRKKLFISYKPSKTDEIKKATISSWIVKLIRLAYATEGSNPCALELHKVSAHEVRALSASTSVFRGMNADIIMQSCTWRARSTFSDFYLRDMCSLLDDIYVMSSSVAGT